MIVYGSTLSPYVRKVMAFLAEKGLTAELKPGGMGRGGPEFAAASPFGKMPGFTDGDYGLSDSSAIVAYVEAKHPEPSLIPAEPRARGRTIWFDEFADTIVMAAGAKMFFNRFVAPKVLKRPGDTALADAAEANDLPPLLAYLETQIPPSGFLVEDRLTLADIAVASPFANFRHIAVAIDPALYPRTIGYVDAILSRPSFAPLLAAETQFVQSLG
ncbi:glutathione S-transferase family protein [Sphingomonas donggukensis]|uniref:glutathione transferase n=1 Tax=Sphingomonas donggukensis TaxID=2949093 RepID=A0ABY4TRQ7_9SPHN|nr:glutathione S-transferase family protein [Sphingomonas donggukensis]URW75065.1 glutathione S-transferase family protein [Sphingomonas donggukensis]